MNPPSVRVIYIGGCGRSGTTLLARMLGSFPGVAAVGELFQLGREGIAGNKLCGCGADVGDCPFWTDVVDRAFAGRRTAVAELVELRRRVDRNRHIPRAILSVLAPRAGQDQDRYRAALAQIYRAITDVSGCDTVVDSSKHACTAFLARRLSSVDLHVVHLIRDSRGVAYSWTKTVPQPERGSGEVLMDRSGPLRSAGRWLLYNSLFALLGRMGQPMTRVRYEDLVRCPRREVGRILEEAGVSRPARSDAHIGSGDVHLRPSHSVAGNPMRFRSGQLSIDLDDEWRRRLPRGQRRMVTALTAPMLGAYGYSR